MSHFRSGMELYQIIKNCKVVNPDRLRTWLFWALRDELCFVKRARVDRSIIPSGNTHVHDHGRHWKINLMQHDPWTCDCTYLLNKRWKTSQCPSYPVNYLSNYLFGCVEHVYGPARETTINSCPFPVSYKGLFANRDFQRDSHKRFEFIRCDVYETAAGRSRVRFTTAFNILVICGNVYHDFVTTLRGCTKTMTGN